MASFALTDATIWVDGYDFTSQSNSLTLAQSAQELDVTTFGSGGWRQRIAGLKDVDFQLGGFWESAASAAVDPQIATVLGTADKVFTVAPDDAEGTTAYLFRAGHFSYDILGQVGEAAPFTAQARGTNGQGLVRGAVLKAKGNVSATGATGSVVQVGAVGASQYLYATLHCFSAGTTITVQVQSDDNSGMSSPTTRATFTAVTAVGGSWVTRVAGPITDTYWRFNVSAVTGTFQIAGAVGIG